MQVLSQPDAAQQGFDPSIFIDPDKLHLTLLMLKLYSDEARHKAAQALQGLRPQVRLGVVDFVLGSFTAMLSHLVALLCACCSILAAAADGAAVVHPAANCKRRVLQCGAVGDASCAFRVCGLCVGFVQVESLLGGQPLRLSLKGLDYMSDDPTDMHVLYLKVCAAAPIIV